MKRFAVIGIFVLAVGTLFTFAEASKVAPKVQDSNVPAMMQESMIKTMIDLISRSVSRRYDLRPDQADVARQMLEKNTSAFLNTHWNELLVLVPQMQDLRMKAMNGQEPTAAQVKALAEKMEPLYKEAIDLIVAENDKFHNILDETQKVKHQQDLDRMKVDVAQTVAKLDRWKEGGYKPGEFLNKPVRQQPAPAMNEPPLPQEKMTDISVSYWEEYVKQFIAAYQLDSGQIPMAYTVLNDIKSKAKAYRDDHAQELVAAKREIHRLESAPASTQPNQAKDLAKAKERLAALEKPLRDMFADLTQRLMAIPTDEQCKAVLETSGEGKPAAATDAKKEEKK